MKYHIVSQACLWRLEILGHGRSCELMDFRHIPQRFLPSKYSLSNEPHSQKGSDFMMELGLHETLKKFLVVSI